MYRDRLVNTPANSPGAQQLQDVLLRYHDFRQEDRAQASETQLSALASWQSKRLQTTHHDLYSSEQYRTGLDFLLSELYSAQDFSARDQDLERIFPKLVKLMPESVLGTVALLVELNLETQRLDQALASELFSLCDSDNVDQKHYCEAYRRCDNKHQRYKQIELISKCGELLDRYARSNTILFSLKISRKPADMAGLAALHGFIHRGFKAFHTMNDIPSLMDTVVRLEKVVLERIFAEHPTPFAIHNHTTVRS